MKGLAPTTLKDELACQVVTVLEKHSQLTIAELDRHLSLDFGVESSLATLYRRIDRLFQKQVLIRHKGMVSLHPVWIDDIVRRAKLLETRQQDSSRMIMQLPLKEGSWKNYHADSLAELDPIWNSIQLEVIALSQSSEYMGFNSHPWHAISVHESERKVFQSIVDKNTEVSLLFGHRTPLSQHAVETLTFPGCSLKTLRSPVFGKDGFALWASESYVVSCEFPSMITERFSEFFHNTNSIDTIDFGSFDKVFREKAPFSLKVQKSRRRAEKVRLVLREAS